MYSLGQLKEAEPLLAKLATNQIPGVPRDQSYYYWYYGCLSLFQHQGPVWEAWNEQMKKVFLKTQVRKGDEAGSWPPTGKWTKAAADVSCQPP